MIIPTGSLETFVASYGYLAVLLGSFFEGETVLIAMGFLADSGFLNIFLVILISFIGTFLFEKMLFFIGRFKGHMLIKRIKKKSIRSKIRYVHGLFEKYPNLAMFGLRFVYGFRSIRIIVMSTSRMHTSKFILMNSLSILIWVVFWNMMGYVLGESIQILLGKISHMKWEIFLIILAAGFVIWLYHFLTNRMLKNKKIKI